MTSVSSVATKRVSRSHHGHRVVTLASSLGGLSALRLVLSALPPDFGAAVLAVQHLDPHRRSLLAGIMSAYTRLPVRQAEEADAVEPGLVLFAPPNRHLLVTRAGRVHLTEGEPVHFVRPSADLLFQSAAAVYGSRVIGVVLTGMGVDGSLGVQAVKHAGGTVIAQDEATSESFGMPGSAILTGDVDYVLPLEEIAARLIGLVEDD